MKYTEITDKKNIQFRDKLGIMRALSIYMQFCR